jgi:RNA polymerase sigma factor (sigma-70 family)
MLKDLSDDELLDLFMRVSDAGTIHLLRDTLCDRMTAIINQAIEKHASATSLPVYESREDIRQEAYKAFIIKIDALKRNPGQSGIRDIRAYVYGIAKNECNGGHRSRRRRSRIVSCADVSEDFSSDEVVDLSLTQDQRLILKEFLMQYLHELERLPDKYRQVLMLGTHRKYGPETLNLLLELGVCNAEKLASLVGLSPEQFQGLSIPLTRAEIAAVIGKSEEEVVSLQEAAFKRLKRRKLSDLLGFRKK